MNILNGFNDPTPKTSKTYGKYNGENLLRMYMEKKARKPKIFHSKIKFIYKRNSWLKNTNGVMQNFGTDTSLN